MIWGWLRVAVEGVGFGGADKWAFSIGDAGVWAMAVELVFVLDALLSRAVLSGAGLLVTVRCCTSCSTFAGVGVDDAEVTTAGDDGWLGYVIGAGVARTLIPS